MYALVELTMYALWRGEAPGALVITFRPMHRLIERAQTDYIG